MSIFPRPLKKVLGKIIPFSLVDLIPTFNLGTGVASTATFLRGDQTWSTVPAISGGGGNNVNYYLNGGTAASVGTYYQMSNTPVIGTGVDFSLSGNGLITQWLTDAGNPNTTEIPAGNWNFEMFMSASSSGGVPKFYMEILKYDGSTFTTIANNSAVPEGITGGTSIDLYLSSVAVPFTSLLITDRIAVRVYIVDNTPGRTITQHTQDSHLCQIITSFSSGISSINTLTKNTQYIVAGTSGSDFNVSSSVDTHTLNLPTASALKRGAVSSVDWSTFNAKQNPITLTTTGTGAATFVADVLNIPTPSAGGSSGIFGISDSAGVYTYYATFSLAMTAATSGKTIEMFADVVETTNIAITLKDGVNINGNGHTYTLNQVGTANCIQDGGLAVNCSISNITFKRLGGTASSINTICMYITGASKIKAYSTILIGGATNMRCLTINNANAEVYGIYAEGYNPTITVTNGTLNDSTAKGLNGGGISVGASGKIVKCIGYGVNVGGINNAGLAIDCTAYDGGVSGFGNTGTAINCIGWSGGQYGFAVGGGSTSINCIGYSTVNAGFHVNGAVNVISCKGYSTANAGIVFINGIAYDSIGFSAVSNGIIATNSGSTITELRSCKAISLASIAIFMNNLISGCKIYNTEVYSKWNNAGGHGIKVSGNNAEIVQCTIEVSNASANAINAVSALTTKYANNAFKGATTAINANITQGMINVHDLQGNILI